jgi:hypothetical protein
MRVEIKTQKPPFQPFDLVVTIQKQEELIAIQKLFHLTGTIPETVEKTSHLTTAERNTLRNFMQDVHYALQASTNL